MRQLPPGWSGELRRQSCRCEEAFSNGASEAARDQERHLGRNPVDAETPIATALMIALKLLRIYPLTRAMRAAMFQRRVGDESESTQREAGVAGCG